MSFAFATDVKREDADETARRARLSARAREERGRGGGQATIESSLTQVDGGTRIDIVTDMTLSGPVAQYGRGMVEDVAAQLTRRFAECLEAQLAAPARPEASAATARDREPPPSPAKALAGLPLVLGALRRALVRLIRRREP
jgi:uncharacterized protein